MCVQNKQKTAFNLFTFFCNMKKTGRDFVIYSPTFLIREEMRSNQAEGWFLVYSSTFVIGNIVINIVIM